MPWKVSPSQTTDNTRRSVLQRTAGGACARRDASAHAHPVPFPRQVSNTGFNTIELLQAAHSRFPAIAHPTIAAPTERNRARRRIDAAPAPVNSAFRPEDSQFRQRTFPVFI